MKTKILLSTIFICMTATSFGQWTYTNLPEAKSNMGSTSLGSKAYFAGGNDGQNSVASAEAYDVSTGMWEVLGDLSVAREVISGVACGNKIFFGGGFDWTVSYSTVDIFDTETQQWTVEQLSVSRFSMAAVSCGSKVLFAGGFQYPNMTYTAVVDMYDTETEEWTTTSLSLAREGIAAAVVGNKAIFAGGKCGTDLTTDIVDIYNFSTGLWSTKKLSQARGFASATTIGNKVYIAGGITSRDNPTNRVDIYNSLTGTWETTSLSDPRASQGNAATINGKAYFAGGGNFMGDGYYDPSNVVDIYDPVTETWSVDILSQTIMAHSVVSVGNYLIVAGGEHVQGIPVSTVEIFYDPPESQIIHVPDDYPTIQQGIEAANPGDTILVSDGLYYENINFMGKKPLMVASEFLMDGDTNHIINTIIDGSQPIDSNFGSVVLFNSGEDTTSVLCGFTITGGSGTIEPSVNGKMGGGVHISYSGAKLLSNIIQNNIISYDGLVYGGAIQAGGPITDIPWVVIRNNRITNNKAISSDDEGLGGGIANFYNLILVDNEISHNEVNCPLRCDGGGVSIGGIFGTIRLEIKNNQITQNKTVSVSNFSQYSIGGGLSIAWNCSGIVSNNVISYNEIESSDGTWGQATGVLVQEVIADDFIFENNFITNNTYTGQLCMGGGLLLYNSGGKFQNNVIRDNPATHGGGIAIEDSPNNQPVFINNTVTGNTATTEGGGLFLKNSSAIVINTIIWGNTAPTGTAIYQEGSNNLEVRYSDVEGDDVWPGEGNINEDPQFTSDNYHLDYQSMMANTGSSSVIINGESYDCPVYDVDGEDRPYSNTLPDIGADEAQWQYVSVKESILSKLNLFPNPANQFVRINFEEGAAIQEVTIYNQTGQKVYSGIPENNTLDISKLQPGMYVVEVVSKDGNVKKKLVVQ